MCLSGAGRMMNEVGSLRRGLDEGGVAGAIERFEWSDYGLDLSSVDAKKGMARRLAKRIRTYQQLFPGRPVHLVGVSAGTGLIVWALEDLSVEEGVTGAILLASSLSRHYDLTRALQSTKGRLYHFHSLLDVVSAAAAAVRTVDGRHTTAAGFGGFQMPEGADDLTRALYAARLLQIAWEPGDVLQGNVGDHLGPTRTRYVKRHVAPLISGGRPPVPKPLRE